jgi:eukaryotic-like serine/threonine-protein kinase
VGVWSLGHHGSTPRPHNSPTQQPTHSARPLTVLPAASAAAFGPNGGDNGAQAPLAIDNSPATDWTTDSYQGSAHFGNLYGGTGLVLDMGKQVTVSSVAVTFGSVPGAHVRVEVGNNNSGTSPAGATTLDHTSNAFSTVTFTGHPVKGQFVFIWFTKLAPQQGSPGHFQADVFNVVVKGSS